jgi:hypothetical protein
VSLCRTLRKQQTPENIFYSLIGKGLEKSEAESFGKTMALDMLTLYETAADKYFELGKYQRAFEYSPPLPSSSPPPSKALSDSSSSSSSSSRQALSALQRGDAEANSKVRRHQPNGHCADAPPRSARLAPGYLRTVFPPHFVSHLNFVLQLSRLVTRRASPAHFSRAISSVSWKHHSTAIRYRRGTTRNTRPRRTTCVSAKTLDIVHIIIYIYFYILCVTLLQALESDFRLFLRENEDYDPKTALELLHSHGLMQDFFIVRHYSLRVVRRVPLRVVCLTRGLLVMCQRWPERDGWAPTP